jgi:hypothetical protein
VKLNLLALIFLPAVCAAADFTVSVDLAGQPVAIPVSAQVSQSSDRIGIALHADLAEFQSHLTPLLQSELNQSNRCGERIAVENAVLTPSAPTGQLSVRLHFEKWTCIKAFGKENAKRLIGGNGTVQVTLTPVAEQGGSLRLNAEVGNIDADGSLGEALRSGSLGETLRSKIRESLVNALRKSADFSAMLPAEARQFVTIDTVAFGDEGNGHLSLNTVATLKIPAEQATALVETLRSRR